MKGTKVPNPRRSSACDCTCVLTRIDHCLVTLSCLPCTFFCSSLCQVRSRVSDALSQALCKLSLAFLADFTLLILLPSYVSKVSLAKYTLLFVWNERHDHSVHMFSVLQLQQFYTAGISLLEAYLLPMATK